MNGTLAAGFFLGEGFLDDFFLDAGFLGGADFLATGLFFALFETGITSSSSDSLSRGEYSVWVLTPWCRLKFLQSLAFFGWVSHNPHLLYLEISCQQTCYQWLEQECCYGNHWKKDWKKVLFSRRYFGKILLNKVYNCL